MDGLNFEKVAEAIAESIIKSDEFKKFCNEYACALEDKLREELEAKFVEPVEKYFNFREDDCDYEMEFVLTLVGDLTHAFMKSFVTDYLGRKW